MFKFATVKEFKNEFEIHKFCHRQIKVGRYFRRNIVHSTFIFCHADEVSFEFAGGGLVHRLGSWLAFPAFYPRSCTCFDYTRMEI